ncbi:hypothetical protein [Lachnobacterium bovis]|uniref:hypothetical protein n=1 Tax=Lachnobacterium bovis TaxID=140626 RepID=UPI0004841EB9|nr:hypothetical protein [Lachnobacterium bovis]
MLRYFQLKGRGEETEIHAIVSLLLAIYCMIFSNELIGGMGGLPIWSGILLSYYIMRLVAKSKSNICHTLPIGSLKEVDYILCGYILIFMVSWGIVKIMVVASRMIGWSNLNGMSPGEYIDSIYGSSLFERWAYFIAWIIVAAFAISLFPLVVIKTKRFFMLYLLIDSGIFYVVCKVIIVTCGSFLPQKNRRMHIKTLLDYMLVCHMPRRLVATGIIGLMGIGLALIVLLVRKISHVIYAPSKVNTSNKKLKKIKEYIELSQEEKKAHKIKKLKITVSVLFAIFCLGVGLVKIGKIIKYNIQDEEGVSYVKVAECLTNDKAFGPICYKNKIYVPIDETFNFDKNGGKPLGYLGYKGQNCQTQLYKLTIGNMLYKNMNDDPKYKYCLEMSGADYNSYKRVDKVEKEAFYKQDKVFVLWDEDWINETSYGADKTGYTIIEKGFVERLVERFGKIKYNPNDFKSYDTYFTIRSYQESKSVNGSEIVNGNWVGCILVKNNKFYFGNYKNQITGIELKELLDILGGNINQPLKTIKK